MRSFNDGDSLLFYRNSLTILRIFSRLLSMKILRAMSDDSATCNNYLRGTYENLLRTHKFVIKIK